jgi:hypothetical protein
MGLFDGGGGGFLGDIGGAFSSGLGSLGDALRPVQQAGLALPGIAATGQNYLLQAGIGGAGQLLQNPQALAGIAGSVMSGGATSGVGGLSGILGGLGQSDTLANLMRSFSGGSASGNQGSAGPTIVAAPTQSSGTPSWVMPVAIGAGVLLIAGIAFVALKK